MSVSRVALEEPAGNVIYYLKTLPELLNSPVAVFGDVFKKTRDATDAENLLEQETTSSPFA